MAFPILNNWISGVGVRAPMPKAKTLVKVVMVIEGAVSMKTSVNISLRVSSEVVDEDLSLPVVELESFSLFLK